ncbi:MULTISPECIES: hypothetical protein [Salinibaculum]|uniref:hypothetical protein n=1 Tax=Salinibaculum TaxID=2732368 RepID=UPI0030D01470
MTQTLALRRWQVRSTLAILALSAASSLLGLFRDGHYTDPSSLLARITAEDAVILLVAVPVLAVGLWGALRGSRGGRVVWLGALAYMTYMWATIGLNRSFNDFFLGYVALFALSLFTLAAGMVRTDPAPFYRTLQGRARRLYAGFLLVTAGGLAALWVSDVVPAILAGTTPSVIEQFGPQGVVTYVVDLGVVVPSLAVVAVWLWRDRRWGDLCAGVLLVFAALLAPGISAITVVDLQTGVEMTAGMVVGSILPPVLGAALALDFLRRLPGRGPGDAGEGPSLAD